MLDDDKLKLLKDISYLSNKNYDKLVEFIIDDMQKLLYQTEDHNKRFTELASMCIAVLALGKQLLETFPEAEQPILSQFSDALLRAVKEDAKEMSLKFAGGVNSKDKILA